MRYWLRRLGFQAHFWMKWEFMLNWEWGVSGRLLPLPFGDNHSLVVTFLYSFTIYIHLWFWVLYKYNQTSDNILTGFFGSVLYLWDSCTVLIIVIFYSLSFMYYIPIYEQTKLYLSIMMWVEHFLCFPIWGNYQKKKTSVVITYLNP